MNLQTKLIDHILRIKQLDEEYARWALKNYETIVPELELIKGVRERLNALCTQG